MSGEQKQTTLVNSTGKRGRSEEQSEQRLDTNKGREEKRT